MATLPPLPQGAKLNASNTVLDVFGADADKSLPPLPEGAKLSGGLPPLPEGAKLVSTPPAHQPTLPAPKSASEAFHNVLPNKPGSTYGMVLPYEKDAAGKVSLAVPEMIRSIPHGIGDLYEAAENKSLETTPEAAGAVLAMAGGSVASRRGAKAPVKPVEPPAPSDKPGVLKSLQNVFSPTDAGPGAKSMETTLREGMGEANRNIAGNEAVLARSAKDVAKMSPEDTLKFYEHVENVSRKEGDIPLNPKMMKFAEDTRGIMQDMRKRLESLPDAEKMGFYEDYFPHYWKNPEQARQFTTEFIARQGSSAATKKRTYPTIAEGLKAGLQLADPNPIRAASRYVTSTNNYIAAKDIVTQAIKKGDMGYYPPGSQPEGWVPLVGRFAERPGTKLYAPKDAALIYNNTYKPGLEATQLGTPYEALRAVTAANTAAELSLSAYHAMTITAQNMFSDVGRVLKNITTGDWEGVGKALKSATAGQLPGIKGGSYEVGRKFVKQYKGLEDYGIDMESVAQHFAKAGGKLGQEKLYRVNPEGGFVHAWKHGQLGTVGRELKDTALSGPAGALKASYQTLSRLAEDVAYPLFEHYIPRVKTGAFANLMSDWIRQNPGASEGQIAKGRIKILDMVDDRFGEMNMDNIFWAKMQKQLGSLLLRAQGWDIGLVRQAGGGVLDAGRILKSIATGGGFDKQTLDRPLFLAAATMTSMLINSAYQYLKTGEAPQDGQDLILPRTGGKMWTGKPERVMMPGHGREIIQAAPEPGHAWYSGLVHEASNKIASLPKNIYQALNNENYQGHTIGGPLDRVAHVAGGFTPFTFSDSNAPMKGTNIGKVERNLGMRPAGMRFIDPKRQERAVKRQEKRKEKEKKRAERRAESRLLK